MQQTRRQFFFNAALAAFCASPGRIFSATAEAAQITADPVTPIAQFKVGDATVTAIYDGVWERPYPPSVIANASVADVKAALNEAKLPDAFLTLPFTVSVISHGDEVILCDAGSGGQVVPTAGQFMKNFKAAGFDPAKVSKILISHCHPDHIFGLMEKGSNAPVFPNAEILISDVEYQWWTDPAVFNKLPEDRKPLAQRIQAVFPSWKNITQVSGEKEVARGISFVESPGHTPGHRSFLLNSGSAQHMFSNDTMYMPALAVAHPDWMGIFDQDAAKAVLSRRKLMDRLAAENMGVSGYHFPFPAYGKINKDGDAYSLTMAQG